MEVSYAFGGEEEGTGGEVLLLRAIGSEAEEEEEAGEAEEAEGDPAPPTTSAKSQNTSIFFFVPRKNSLALATLSLACSLSFPFLSFLTSSAKEFREVVFRSSECGSICRLAVKREETEDRLDRRLASVLVLRMPYSKKKKSNFS